LPIRAISNFNYCRTSITSFNENVGYNANGIETVKSFWKLVSKDRFPEPKDFALKMHSTFGNAYMCKSTYIFCDE